MPETPPRPEIIYDPDLRQYACFVNDELIYYARTMDEAESLLATFIRQLGGTLRPPAEPTP